MCLSIVNNHRDAVMTVTLVICKQLLYVRKLFAITVITF
jgi:hypothetical protein